MKKIKTLFTVFTLSLMLLGCTAIDTPIDDDYKFGDTTASILVLQHKYCTEFDPVQRMIYRKALQRLLGTYPSKGVCTDIVDVLTDNYGVDNANKHPED